MADAYEVLGVRKSANQEEIKAAYRKLVKELHPDKYIDNPLAYLAEERLKAVNAAYEFLTGKASEFSHDGGYSEWANRTSDKSACKSDTGNDEDNKDKTSDKTTNGNGNDGNNNGSDNPKTKPPFPVLETWKTSIGLFICGAICYIIINFSQTPDTWWIFDIVTGGLLTGFRMYYALGVYPSLFSEHPKLKSNGAISFLNGLFGFIIFGCLWNGNLTKKYKGISNKVYVILQVVFISVSVWTALE